MYTTVYIQKTTEREMKPLAMINKALKKRNNSNLEYTFYCLTGPRCSTRDV